MKRNISKRAKTLREELGTHALSYLVAMERALTAVEIAHRTMEESVAAALAFHEKLLREKASTLKQPRRKPKAKEE